MKIKIGSGYFEAEILDEWWEEPRREWTKEDFATFEHFVATKDRTHTYYWNCTTKQWVGKHPPKDPIVFTPRLYTRGAKPNTKNGKAISRKFVDKLKAHIGVKEDLDFAKAMRSKFGIAKISKADLEKSLKGWKNYDCVVKVVVEYLRVKLVMKGASADSLFVVSIPHHAYVQVFPIVKCTEVGKIDQGELARKVPAKVDDIELDKTTKTSEKIAKKHTEDELAKKLEEAEELKKEIDRLKKEMKKYKEED